jgi:hypothetical protein
MADLRRCRLADAAPLTALRDGLFRIGARIVRDYRSIIFLMAEVAVPRELLRRILAAIADIRPMPAVRR